MAKPPPDRPLSDAENRLIFEDWILQLKSCEEDPVLQMNARGFPPRAAISVHKPRPLVLRPDDEKEEESPPVASDLVALADEFFEIYPDEMRNEDSCGEEDVTDDDDDTTLVVARKKKQLKASVFSEVKGDDSSASSKSFRESSNMASSAPPSLPYTNTPAVAAPAVTQNPYTTDPPPPVQNPYGAPPRPATQNPYAAPPPVAPTPAPPQHNHAGGYPLPPQQHQQHPYQATPTVQPPQHVNPYYANGSRAQSTSQAPPPPPQWGSTPSAATNSYTQQWEAHHNSQQQLQNPFQTARDLSHQQSHQQPDPPNGSTSPPPPPQPAIRPSLKRKFQPPKRTKNAQHPPGQRAAPLKNQSNHHRNNNNAVPVASTKSDGPNNDDFDAAANDDDDDDELPEELQKYGKELVEAIESEILSSCATISFADIAGLPDQKAIVREVVCWPMTRPDLFTGLRRVPNGLLLYGPPGTGKTLIGKAIAHESTATFFGISSSSLTSKWMGQGEKLVRTLFAVAAYREPAVVFIDEIDSLLKARSSDENEATRRIKTEFLVQIDGVGSQGARVLVIGATNRPQELDDAARRRFTKRLYIPLPAQPDREELLLVLLQSCRHALDKKDIQQLATETAGFSGADLKSMAVRDICLFLVDVL